MLPLDILSINVSFLNPKWLTTEQLYCGYSASNRLELE